MYRSMRIGITILASCLLVSSVARAEPPVSGSFAAGANLHIKRRNHTANKLPNGDVVLIGGRQSSAALSSAECYSPHLQQAVIVKPLTQARFGHTASTLSDGTVLVLGGLVAPRQATNSSEVYDHQLRAFKLGSEMTIARYDHSATKLPDGRVVIIGGQSFSASGEPEAVTLVEVYEPKDRTIRTLGHLKPRSRHTATLLPGGLILLVGGRKISNGSAVILNTTEIFAIERGQGVAGRRLRAARYDHTATLLQDGRVLIVGGSVALGTPTSAAEIYDPFSGRFHALRHMVAPRSGHTATRLQDGRVLLIGWGRSGQQVSFSELFDPSRALFVSVGPISLSRSHQGHTATLLDDGRVLVSGGQNGNQAQSIGLSELFKP